MQIDWLTVAAQIVNFLILVWLLQRFLFQPITRAMEDREARIEERLAEARSARGDAEAEAEKLREKQAELEASREEALDQARNDADALREDLQQQVRDEIGEKRRQWHQHLEEEREDFERSLQKKAGHRVIEITGRILQDYADSDFADRIAEVFVGKLKDLEEETREKLSKAAENADDAAIVESGVTLKQAARGKITRAIHETLSTDIEVEYRESEDIILGLRLSIAEQSLEWSAGRYLQALEGVLDEALEAERVESAAAED